MRPVLLPVVVALIAALASPPALAQKLYRWTDKDGKEHYSDTLPSEAIDAAREELNKASGSTVGQVERALTQEERATMAASAEAEAELAKRAEDQRQRDRVLLSSYPSEAELQRTYNERLTLVEESVKSAQVGIEGQRNSLASLLAHATDRELAGQPVAARTVANLREAHRQIGDQQTQLSRREAEHAALKQELDEVLSRYRALKENPPEGPAPP